MSRRYGLTLIEMLAVIAIIATLAAILFPVFARARETARATSCLNNVMSISVALRLYANDHGGLYPPVEDDLTPIIDRYCRDEQSFRCPSASNPVPMGAPANLAPPPAEAISTPSQPAGPGVTLTQGPPPGMGGGGMPGPPGAMGGPPMPPGAPAPTGPPAVETNYYYRAGFAPGEWPAKPLVSDHDALHNERANVLFTDGHADRLTRAEWLATGLVPIDEVWTPAMPGMGGMGMPGPPGPGMMGAP